MHVTWARACVIFLLSGGLASAQNPVGPQPAPVLQPRAGIDALEAGIMNAEAGNPDRAALAFRTNYPLACLQARKVRLLAGHAWGVGNGEAQLVAAGQAALERLARQEPYLATKGRLCESAYITANDGTAQPYYLYLPESYTPDRQWPLIVFLHGYVPTTSILDPWVLGPDVCQIAGENGCALLIPHGRRNTDFQGVGEVDVLAATEEVKALYPIDPQRVYISGVSMGGMGAWNMALRHPGMYAAASPMSGQTDMHVWWPRVLPNWPRSRDGIPPFRRFLIEWDNPVDLVSNARNQPIFVQHGELDQLIPVSQSRTMVAEAAKLGIPIKLFEFAGASHYIYWDLPCFRNAWSWTKDFRLDESPKRVTYKTYSLQYGTAFWLTITDLLEWGTPATVDCQVSADGAELSVTATNVGGMRVDLRRAPLRALDTYEVMVNGRSLSVKPTPARTLEIALAVPPPSAPAWPPRKRAGLCGPLEEVFDTRFLLVAGTTGEARTNAELVAKMKQWARDWDEFADGPPPQRLDHQVTEQEIASCNLILFGTPASNAVLARIADRLPIRIEDHQFTVAGKVYAGPDLGLVMCYPNPLAPERYVAIYAGEPYGAKCGTNHKHDLIPDFIVFKARSFSYDDTNEHEAAGYFDLNWQLSEKLTWVRAK